MLRVGGRRGLRSRAADPHLLHGSRDIHPWWLRLGHGEHCLLLCLLKWLQLLSMLVALLLLRLVLVDLLPLLMLR